ncbi:MAG: hypothetical protein H5U07_10460, partial [Candidatus Aminicenantes bacterium]|nr:hypothetical protein [Candidatus Aminicenantes bacterium]
ELSEQLNKLKKFLENRSFEEYATLCVPEIREEENAVLQSYFKDLGMERLRMFYAGGSQDTAHLNRAYFHVLLNNQFQAMIEIWQFSYRKLEEEIEILERQVISSQTNLYFLKFPGLESKLARNVIIEQKDIRITFSEAEIFFDNLPDFDTAMIVVGKGKVRFYPSDEIERHQLLRRFKKPFLEDDLEYVYLRAADSFFHNNLKYEEAESIGLKIPEEVVSNKIYSIYARNYPRSFTVEFSLTKELLTFIPQSDETVIEIKTAKKGEFTYIFSPFAEEEISFFDRTRNSLLNSYSPRVEEPGLKRMFVRLGERFLIRHYNLDVSYSPENKVLSARAGLRIQPVSDSLDSLQFRLNSALKILKIVDEKGRELYYTQDRLRNYLYIYLAEKPARDKDFQLQVYYRGKFHPAPPTSDVMPQKIPQGTRIFVSAPQDSFLFSQSADWYPAPVRDKYFTFSLRLIVPEGYYCLSTGRLKKQREFQEVDRLTELESESLGHQIFAFGSLKPVKYISFFLARLRTVKKVPGEPTLEFLVSQEWSRSENELLEEGEDILKTYQDAFGPYPYEKLSVVQHYWNTGGGYSPPGFIILNYLPFSAEPGLILLNPNSPVVISSWQEYFLAHEMAHQWWGQGVTYATYRDNWLSEGLAQFSAVFYLEKKYGRKEAEKILQKFSRWTKRKSKVGPIILGYRLAHVDYEAYQAIVYDKAALVLFLLRDLLGEKVFLAALKDFYQKNMFRAVKTVDFRLCLEKVSGRNLEKFFQDWFYSERLPSVKVSKKIISGEQAGKLILTIQQQNQPLWFPLEISIETSSGKYTRLLEVDKQEQQFEIEYSGKLKKVKVNPNHKVPGYFK